MSHLWSWDLFVNIKLHSYILKNPTTPILTGLIWSEIAFSKFPPKASDHIGNCHFEPFPVTWLIWNHPISILHPQKPHYTHIQCFYSTLDDISNDNPRCEWPYMAISNMAAILKQLRVSDGLLPLQFEVAISKNP